MLDEPLEVEVVVGWLDPEAPVEILQEGHLEQVQLLQGHTPDIRDKVVAIEYVIVELGGH